MWEVCDPANGIPVYIVPFAWIARLLARLTGLDYARKGEGWV